MACSTFSKNDCKNMNWQNAGYQTALDGEKADHRIKYYLKECTNEHKVTVNLDAFTKGYDQGIKIYCSEANLYQKGLSGKIYKNICKESESTANFSIGRSQYLEKKVLELENDIQRLNNDIDDLRRKKSDLESKLNACTNISKTPFE